MHFLIGFAVTMSFLWGLLLTPYGLNEGDPGIAFGGAALFIASWFAARAQSGGWSLNGFGTCFYGEIESPSGDIHTKWLCIFFFPVIPVRSFYLLHATGQLVGPDEYKKTFTHVPLAGLGLYWPSVGRTAIWTVIGAVLLVAYGVFFKNADSA